MTEGMPLGVVDRALRMTHQERDLALAERLQDAREALEAVALLARLVGYEDFDGDVPEALRAIERIEDVLR